MKKLLVLMAMVLGVIPAMGADISIQTKIYDTNSQPMLVGGFIENYSKQKVSKKGIIVSKNADDLIITDDTKFDKANVMLHIVGYETDKPIDTRFIDCTDTNEEQYACALQYLEGNIDYYVKSFVIDNENNVVYGDAIKVHTQDYNRYDGYAGYGNVWYAFKYTLFDLVTDEIINPYDGFYYTTNENPTHIGYQVGTSYNTCYKVATEWNYKLWYCQRFYGTVDNNSSLVVHLPVMKYNNGLLTIEKSPLDADKDITIFYSINGNYFRPETYTEIYTNPIEISEPCAVYCYAISSDGYISYTNMYVIEKVESNDFGKVADVVDLGLSVKWASWNVGASSIGDYGGLYGAGDPTGQNTSTSYADYYWKDGESICGTDYDLAKAKWGEEWRMPKWSELEELITKCQWKDGEVNGVKGNWVTGPNGNSIFLPWAGNRKGASIFSDEGIKGYYWSGDMGVSLHSYGYKDIDVKSGGVFQTDGAECFWGQSIRPVYVEENDEPFGTVADVVDLGLSVKWASWNIGANAPEADGYLLAWGELSPKEDYSASTYKFYNGSYTKYGSIDNKYTLDKEDDAAHQLWGNKWRMPTIEELTELKEKCDFSTTELNGVPVTKVTGPNGNSIYFPYPGNFTGDYLYFRGSVGSYWSSNLNNDSYALDLDFLGGSQSLNDDTRYHGQSIRPVYVNTQSGIETTIISDSDNSVIYNLHGQRMQTITKGINIINGKKVIIK